MTTAPKLANLSGIEEVLAGSLTQERWFADKHRTIEALRLTQVYSVQQETPALVIVLVEVTFADGPAATYQMLVGLRPWDRHLPATLRSISRRVGAGDDAEGTHPGPTWAVYDGLADPLLAAELLAILSQGSSIKGDGSGELRCRLLHPPLPPLASLQPSQMAPKDQSQSSVLFGDDILVKVLRRVWPGTSPEVEILEALDRAGFAGIARPLGVIEARADGDVVSLAVAQSYLRNGTDGFSLALTSLRDLYGDRLLDADGAVPLPENCVKAVQRQGSSFAGAAAQIGALTGQMHLALAGLTDTPELEARQLSRDDLQIIADDLDSFVERLVGLDDPRLEPLAVHASALHELAQRVVGLTPTGRAIRIHGDYHLGQLLRTDAGWHALDFEGRPALPVAVRRRKATPLQDLAGMLRSFDYAATVALRQQVHATDASAASLEPYGRAWSGVARDAFLGRYLSTIANSDLLPSEAETVQLLLTCLQASQALYEVDYEMRSRPDWVSIPLEGIARLLSAPPGGLGVS